MADGKTITTIIDIAGRVDPSLNGSIKTAMGLLQSLDTETIAATASIAAGIGIVVESGKALYKFLDENVQKASEFEKQMAAVVKVTRGMRDEFGKYTDLYYDSKKEIMDIGTTLPVDMYELPETAAAILQDGTIGIEGLVPALDDALKVGMALDIPTEEAARILSTLRIDLHTTEDGAFRVAEAFNYLGEISGRTPAELAEITSQLAGISEMSGVTVEQLIAMSTAVPNIVPSKVATSLKNFINNAERGEYATGNIAKAFKALGLDAEEFAEAMQINAVDALDDLYDAFQEVDKSQQTAVLSMFSGTRGEEVIAKLLSNYDVYESSLSAIESGVQIGSIDREVESLIDTAAGAQKLYENTFEAFQIQSGDAFLPLKKEFYQFKQEWWDDHADGLIDMFDSIAGRLERELAQIKLIYDAASWVDQKLADGINWLNDKIFPKRSEYRGRTKQDAQGEALPIFKRTRDDADITSQAIFGVKSAAEEAIDKVSELSNSNAGGVGTIINFTLGDADGRIQAVLDDLRTAKNNAVNLANTDFSDFFSNVSAAERALPIGLPIQKTAKTGMPHFATGGFASVPSIFGEAGLEAAISFNPAYRSQNIGYWAESGKRLGVLSEENPFGTNSGGEVVANVTNNYEIVVKEGTRENVVRALRDSEPEFADMLFEVLTRARRSRYDNGEGVRY